MIKFTPRVHENIRSLFASGRGVFPRVENGSSGVVLQNTPYISPIKGGKDYKNLLKFFFRSCNGKVTNNFRSNIERKIALFWFPYRYDPNKHLVEVIKLKDKILGFYALDFEQSSSSLCVDFMALAPDIKNTKMAVYSLLNIGKRIVDVAKKYKKESILWQVDLSNESAKTLYDHLPYDRYWLSDKSFGQYTIKLSKFENALNSNIGN